MSACEATAYSCRCTWEPVAPLEMTHTVHTCACGGSWSGVAGTVTFKAHSYPTLYVGPSPDKAEGEMS